ncbi:hypothetical protein V1478_013971 [Vespula squamosa]|uniref:Uncharacterized protein n=1 Tax=Vespula squamosa TaxID=30214 RepID=A0ABD2A6U1_VESSQ
MLRRGGGLRVGAYTKDEEEKLRNIIGVPIFLGKWNISAVREIVPSLIRPGRNAECKALIFCPEKIFSLWPEPGVFLRRKKLEEEEAEKEEEEEDEEKEKEDVPPTSSSSLTWQQQSPSSWCPRCVSIDHLRYTRRLLLRRMMSTLRMHLPCCVATATAVGNVIATAAIAVASAATGAVAVTAIAFQANVEAHRLHRMFRVCSVGIRAALFGTLDYRA